MLSRPFPFTRGRAISIRQVARVCSLACALVRDKILTHQPCGLAGVRTCGRIVVLVDNCYACCVFCWLISVDFCVAFSFLLCVVYFVIKFIKYNDLFFPSLSRVVNPASRLEGDATKYTVTLKPGLGVTQGHWKYHLSIERVRLPIDVLQ